MQKQKIILIDSANLSWMRRPLGIGKFNLYALRELLENLGSLPSVQSPFAYTNPKNYLIKDLKSAGYNVISCPDKDEDDNRMIKHIDELGNDIGEVVIVSGDQGFLLPLLNKRVQTGIDIYWVATQKCDDNGNPIVSTSVVGNPEISRFVDLNEHKNKIMIEAWIDKPAIPRTITPCDIQISATMRCADMAPAFNLVNELRRLQQTFPEMLFTFSITGSSGQ
jgi:hypothetical protein